MGFSKSLTEFVRSFKLTYTISNLLNYKKLKRNVALYKKYGLKKSVIAPISSKDFEKLPPQAAPWLDAQSLKEISSQNAEFQNFSQNIQASLLNWSEDGYAILPGFFKDRADAVNKTIEEKLQSGELKFRYGNKIMFALHHSELIAGIGKDPEILKILSFLLGKQAKVFQSINFIKGSEQRAHSDIVHMTTYPQGYLIAIWVALEDIKEEQGALFYYPGSQKLPYTLNSDFNHGGSYLRLGNNAYKAYEDKVDEVIENFGLQKKVFEAKKGDVLIWHANLLHGGSPITNTDATRKSMVFHYYAEDVICYHEITQRPAVF
jgi:hypothetical protein